MRRGTLAVLSLALTLVPSAFADDLTPPPWRFQPDTTFQHWDFSSGPAGALPDGPGVNLFNPNGNPTLTPVGTATWQPTFNGRNDVWSVFTGGQLVFDVPNHNNPLHQKELWLQVTFFAPAPIINPAATVMSSTSAPFSLIAGPFTTTLANGWVHQLTKWAYPSCPVSEHVTLFPSQPGTTLFVDQVVIDTQCRLVPAPGSVALLGMAGIVGARRRRR